jgi:hypothetical protein
MRMLWVVLIHLLPDGHSLLCVAAQLGGGWGVLGQPLLQSLLGPLNRGPHRPQGVV